MAEEEAMKSLFYIQNVLANGGKIFLISPELPRDWVDRQIKKLVAKKQVKPISQGRNNERSEKG